MAALEVRLERSGSSVRVGRLLEDGPKIAFEYDPAFVALGIELSPFKLPLKLGAQFVGMPEFRGLPGLFFDSLPDGWGLLLMDRALAKRGVAVEQVSALPRLRYVGTRGMGALTFHPPDEPKADPLPIDLTELEREALRVYEGKATKVLDELRIAGGSPGGACPKVLAFISPDDDVLTGSAQMPAGYQPWLIKFAAKSQPLDLAVLEETWARMARSAGLRMPETRLFRLETGGLCFGTRRFDRRADGSRVHMHSACGMLHADFRMPSLDYQTLLRATVALTRDHREVVEMVRRMVFNVLACVRDDHSKNFAWLMSDAGEWQLSPAFDLTFNHGISGHHTTSVLGEGRYPTWQKMWQLADEVAVGQRVFRDICDEAAHSVGAFARISTTLKVPAALRRPIAKRLDEIREHLGSKPWQRKRRKTAR